MTTVEKRETVERITVHNPADGSVVGIVPTDSADEVEKVVADLRAAQPDWEALGPRGRRPWLLKFHDWILDNAESISDVLQSETGKIRVEAVMEPAVAADLVKFWANHAAEYLADRRVRANNPFGLIKHLHTVYRPYQVVGIITPWNFPFVMPGYDAPAALAAGASVLLKPSEVTPLSAAEYVLGWTEIGAPPVLRLVNGYGPTGASVVENVDYVQFTGSTRTGRVIAEQCARRLIPYSLELGGKDPAIVLADANIDRAANGIAIGGLYNSGQICISTERVYVEEPVYDEFLGKLTSIVQNLTQGQDDRTSKFDVGAMATAAQRDIVARHVEEAVAAGARVVTGGKQTGVGTFFEPTVLADVDQSMSCIREETFGPTIPVIKVRDADEAVRLANDSQYGLSATVWTGDRRRGVDIARRLEVGAVNVNDSFSNLFNFRLPMGGWKDSGVGARFGGADGLLKFCRAQAITSPRLPVGSTEFHWYPYSESRAKVVARMFRFACARGTRRFKS